MLHRCAFDTLDPDAAGLPEPLLRLSDHFADAEQAATVDLAKKRNALRRLDAFTVRRADLDAALRERGAPPTAAGAEVDVPWPAARDLLRAAAAARGAYRPLRDLEYAKSYEERVRDMSATKRAALETCREKRGPADTGFHSEKRRLG